MQRQEVRMRWIWWTLAVVAMGCSGGTTLECDEANCIPNTGETGDTGDGGPDDLVQVVDEGTACMEAGDPLGITVTFEDCASSCIRDLQTSCEVSVQGGQIVVTAEASYRPPGSGECDAACNVLQATCSVPEPAAGDYELVYGDAVVPTEVPVTEPDCAEAG
jgi:hypothetical protein